MSKNLLTFGAYDSADGRRFEVAKPELRPPLRQCLPSWYPNHRRCLVSSGSASKCRPAAERLAHSPPSGSGESSSSRSPLHMNLGFLKNLTERKTTREGQTPKRRGPKPDSKPALTRRQELNRQAQRTHRERKELYIKALEQEVLRLKEDLTNVVREKDSVANENQHLKQLLHQHGIALPDSISSQFGLARTGNSGEFGHSSSGSLSGSYAGRGSAPSQGQTSTQQTLSVPDRSGGSQVAQVPSRPQNGRAQQVEEPPRVDYEQIGIDFVLTYDGTPYLSPPPQ
ncbi:MAG: hypothetical protein M1837_003037 [Sclerophora amabilis]|nr:MAG: hypothetical protein M1837_003037 [Sclerophora amabilis]